MNEIKTYKQWESTGLEFQNFIKPLDEIDEELYNYFGEVVAPQYCTHDFIQCGEAWDEIRGVYFYETFSQVDGRYFYLGILPEFKQ